VVLLTIVLALFAGDLAFSLVRLRRSLTVVGDSLSNAQRSLSQEDLQAAADHVALAETNASFAADAEDRPALGFLSRIPWIGDDARAVLAIAEAGQRSAAAASAVIDAAEDMSLSGGNLTSTLYRDGRLQLETIRLGADDISRAAGLLRGAVGVLEGAPHPHLPSVSGALLAARSQIAGVSETAARGDALLRALPGFAGAEEPKRYLLAFQAPSEARATGGLIGFYGILRARDGELKLGHIGPISELLRERRTPVDAPGWFEENYAGVGALLDPRLVNSSPNFPVVGEVLLNLHEAAAGDALDGVVAMDPLALADMMQATGPIQVPGYPEIVTSENVARVMMRDSYLQFSGDEQNTFLTDLVSRFWRDLRGAEFESQALADAIGEAASSRHLQLYTRDEAVQAHLADLDITGDYASSGPNVQMVFHNNYGINKVDFFLERSIDTSISLHTDGSADVTTKVTLVNNAPAGPSSLLLDSSDPDVKTGVNSMLLSFLLPESSEVVTLDMNGEDTLPFEYFDENHPVAWTVLDIPPRQSEVVTLRYRVHGVITRDGKFMYSLVPQPTARSDRYSLVVVPPVGFAISAEDSDHTVAELRSRGIFERTMTQTARLVRK
jgi:hypothetical protein